MALVSLVSPSLSCNTNKLRHKRTRNRSRSWCFTLNNHSAEEWSQLSQPEFLENGIIKIMIQEELGENGTPHIQGFLMFKQQVDFNKIKSLMPKAHIEKCRSPAASIKYCSKASTRKGLMYSYGIKNSEMEKLKLPRLTEEEVCDNLLRIAHNEIDEDVDGFWKSVEIDF